ncbi:MAG: CapA family protein [Tessaracoccus sp.]
MRGKLGAGLLAIVVAGCTPALVGEQPRDEESSSSHTSSADPGASPHAVPDLSPRAVSVNVSGDLLWHNTLWYSAEIDARGEDDVEFDFYPQLASLRPYVAEADLAICHSEVPFAEEGGPYKNYPLFAAPQEIAPALREVGWDLCTTASNHTMDQGWDGLVRTLQVHHDHGILTAGSFATEEDANTPVIFTTEDGVKVAVVSQTFGLNGLSKAAGKPWSVDLLDAGAAIAKAEHAREADADLVLVHMHAGDEYSTRVNSQQREFAQTVTASPAVDMVFGQHAHVAQPIDRVNGKWVIYGTGNLIAASGEPKPLTYEGYLAQVTFTEQSDGFFAATTAEFAPTMITPWSRNTPARVYLIPDELRAGTDLAAKMRESAERTRTIVRSLDVEGLTERE